MLAAAKPESIKMNGQFALWFPDATVPHLRTLPANSAFSLSVGQKDLSWYVFLHLPGAAQEAIAEYPDEKAARRALRNVARLMAGYQPKDKGWYIRWGIVFAAIFFVISAELAMNVMRFQEMNGNPVSVSSGGRPPGAVPMTTSSFTAPPSPLAAAPAIPGAAAPANPYAGAIPAAPVDRTPKPKSTGLSAFGLDERTPPGGLKDIKSNSQIDAGSTQQDRKSDTSPANGGMISGDQKPAGAP